MLCEQCQILPATNHVVSIVGDTITTKELCNECFSLDPDAPDRKFLAGNARCVFCGAPARFGGSAPTALSIAEDRPSYFCTSCFTEFSRYMMNALNRIPKGLPEEQQLEAGREIREQAQRHMEEFVKKPKRRGEGET
jgi:hypothetical protein